MRNRAIQVREAGTIQDVVTEVMKEEVEEEDEVVEVTQSTVVLVAREAGMVEAVAEDMFSSLLGSPSAMSIPMHR